LNLLPGFSSVNLKPPQGQIPSVDPTSWNLMRQPLVGWPRFTSTRIAQLPRRNHCRQLSKSRLASGGSTNVSSRSRRLPRFRPRNAPICQADNTGGSYNFCHRESAQGLPRVSPEQLGFSGSTRRLRLDLPQPSIRGERLSTKRRDNIEISTLFTFPHLAKRNPSPIHKNVLSLLQSDPIPRWFHGPESAAQRVFAQSTLIVKTIRRPMVCFWSWLSDLIYTHDSKAEAGYLPLPNVLKRLM